MSKQWIMCVGNDGAEMLDADEYGEFHQDSPRYVLAADFDKLVEALRKIAAFDPGVFRPLADEIAINNIATDALIASETTLK